MGKYWLLSQGKRQQQQQQQQQKEQLPYFENKFFVKEMFRFVGAGP